MKKKLLVKIIGITLSLIMIVSCIPLAFVNAAEGEISSSLDAFNNPKGNIDELSTDTLNDNPYGYGKGQVFTMAAQNELFTFRSYNLNDGGYYGAYTHENFNPGTISSDIAAARMSGLVSNADGRTNPYSKSNYISSFKKSYVLYHMQTVAFDPTGSGRDDHIAVIGINDDGDICLYVMDAANGNVSDIVQVGANGAGKHLTGNNMQAFEASNYIAITAGRYRNYSQDTAGETLVVYAPEFKSLPTLREYSVTKNKSTSKITVSAQPIASSSTYLHEDYRVGYYGKLMQQEGDVNDSLAVSLATGDFNGDRIDDLAVLSSVSDLDGKFSAVSFQYFVPELYVAYGGGSGSILGKSYKVDELVMWNDDKTEMHSMTSPSVTVGDLDGDGLDDIISAGWHLIAETDSGVALLNKYRMGAGVTVTVHSGDNKGLKRMLINHFDDVDDEDNKSGAITNHWTDKMRREKEGDFALSGKVFIYPQYVVEAVAINGGSAADILFMNGTFCEYDISAGIKYLHTPEYFRHKDSYVNGTEINVEYIASAAVGVFDGNTVGREQITVSVGLKESGRSDYFYMLGTMGGYGYEDKYNGSEIKEYGSTKKIYSTAFDRKAHNINTYDYNGENTYQVYNKGNNDDQYLNCLVAAVDIGNDGILAKYKEKKLIYSDPNIVAVLQAAPYFGELEDTSGETTYTIGTEYTIGEQNSQSTSFSVGISSEMEGPGIKVALGSGYNTSWSKSFDENVTKSYSTTFTAGANNQVIMQRTPIVVYCYEAQYIGTGDWGNEIQVSVPSSPLYVQLTVDDYNDYVVDFNNTLKASGRYPTDRDRLKPIDGNRINGGSLIDNEGVPEKYNKNWTTVNGKNLSDATYGITANDTGNTTSEYTETNSQTTTTEKSDGFYVNASIGTGASFLVGSAYVGVDTSVEGEWVVGSYTTTTKYASASGKVTNLGGVDDVPSHIRSQYGFSWTFGKWHIWLDSDNDSGIPVYGFQVASITRPADGPENLTVSDGETEGTAKLSWDAVADATGYIIYNIDVTGDRNEIGRVDASTTTFTYAVDSRIPFYTFKVSSIEGQTEGAMSDKIIYYPVNSGNNGRDGITPQLNINSKTNMWEVSYDGGTTWTNLGVKATGEKGTDGKNGIAGINGTNGSDGQDGITPGFRINPENNIWEVSYDDGVTWASLRISATGATGKDGAIGKNGMNGITPRIRINPESYMWETSYDNGTSWDSLGIKAIITEQEIEDSDGGGIVSAVMNSEGQLVITLADGSTFKAVSADAAVNTDSNLSGSGNTTVGTVATAALAVSSLSLLWNIISLIVLVTKKRKGI